MATVTENDLKKIEEKIDKLTDKVISEIADIKVSIADLKGEMKGINENIKGELKGINENIKGIDKRLDNIEVLNRIVSGGIVVGIILALFKYLFFSNKLL